jgi:hypothetical protein
MFIRFITTGGTIDKIYFDDLSQFEIGESQVTHILTEGRIEFDYEIVPLLQKDSLDMTDDDRAQLRDYIAGDDADRYVITHGTDTMSAGPADIVEACYPVCVCSSAVGARHAREALQRKLQSRTPEGRPESTHPGAMPVCLRSGHAPTSRNSGPAPAAGPSPS